jgi:phage terminase large subunit-like protein
MLDQQAFTTLEWFNRSTDKQAAAQAFRGMCKQGKIHIPLTDWGEDFVTELVKFPAGAHDDDTDMAALIGLAVNQGIIAQVPERTEPEETMDDYTYEETDEDSVKLL